jgi:hypothetical protein
MLLRAVRGDVIARMRPLTEAISSMSKEHATVTAKG